MATCGYKKGKVVCGSKAVVAKVVDVGSTSVEICESCAKTFLDVLRHKVQSVDAEEDREDFNLMIGLIEMQLEQYRKYQNRDEALKIAEIYEKTFGPVMPEILAIAELPEGQRWGSFRQVLDLREGDILFLPPHCAIRPNLPDPWPPWARKAYDNVLPLIARKPQEDGVS